jgi:DNA-binding transcriptional MocR family regulator
VQGTDFGGDPQSLRLAYSFVSVDEIADGVARLAAAIPIAI